MSKREIDVKHVNMHSKSYTLMNFIPPRMMSSSQMEKFHYLWILPMQNQIIDGVLSHLEEIDTLLEPYCTKRKFELMDKVDRAILRLAIWELNYNSEDVSPSIVINEAVQLAKSFGSDASYKLINAILDAYNKSK